jgi:hypothetical protein
MAQTPEGKVKADIKKYLDSIGFWRAGTERPSTVIGTYHMPVANGMGVHGIPDFVGVLNLGPFNGTRFDIEAKRPGEEPTPNQLKRHEEIRAAGGIVLVIDDVSKLAAWFEDNLYAELTNNRGGECLTLQT